MNHCTGLMGKTCTCGELHDSTELHQESVSVLAGRVFWALGAVCVLAWVGLLALVASLF